MFCPKCTGQMERVQQGEIVVMRCTACKGIWCDMLQAEHVRNLKAADKIDTGSPATGRKHDAVRKVACPQCKEPMIRMVALGQPHIRLESCPVCYGTFFDAGELKDFQEKTIFDFFRRVLGK